jgi:hypothetical protein
MADETNDGAEQKERPAHLAVFTSLEDAKAVEVPSDRFKAYRVTMPDGSEVFVRAQNTDLAVALVAKAGGWTAGIAEPKVGLGPLTAEKAAAKLAELSDEELAALGLSRRRRR